MNKVANLDDLVDVVSAAETISIGGGGIVRKPMAAAAAIGRSGVAPKTLMALLGGPDVDLLIAMGKVRDLLFAYVGLDWIGLAPNFRLARESGRLRVTESSEYLFLSGLEASARGVPFLPSVSGLGTDLLTRPNTPYRTFICPLTGRTLVAAPAIRPDVAIVHVNVADRRGNATIYGEAFADVLLARAAKRVWLTAETVLDELPPIDDRPAGFFIPRVLVAGVVEAPGGADFTGIYPDYPSDPLAAEAYRDNAVDADWLAAYAERVSAPGARVAGVG